MHDLLSNIAKALLMAIGMFWSIGWGLVLGFLISAALQVFVSKEKMAKLLGRDGVKEIAIATSFGAASSSCSYASAAITRTLIQKGSGFKSALAFMFSSTNLVIELGIILYLLMGWQFMAAEWIGGVVLVAIMSLIVSITYPRRLVAQARKKVDRVSAGHSHEATAAQGKTFWDKITSRQTHIAIAQSFVMDWSMLWKDMIAGFLIGGFLSIFVPQHIWQTLFVKNMPEVWQVPLNALIGPIIAVISFLCSDANVPMAAVLWGSGISFGGVLAFLYADLIAMPLLDIYRRYYGWKLAAYIGIVFYVTMVLTGILMDLAFRALGFIPPPAAQFQEHIMHFSLNYTFWLNLIFGAVTIYLIWLARKHSHGAKHHGCGHDHHH